MYRHPPTSFLLKGVFAKNEKGYGLNAIKALLIATNHTSICCVYKEKIVKNDLYRRTQCPSIQIQKDATYDLDRKKNLFNFKQIIQILQPMVIDYLSPHLYIVYIL